MIEKLKILIANKPKTIYFVVVFIAFIWFLSLAKDYGISNDEPIHQVHGKVLLDYFSGNSEIAALSPFDEEGNIIKTFDAVEDDKIRGMNFFGGFFDLIVNASSKILPNADVYNLRHRINAIFGFLIFIFISLIIKDLFGWKWALFAFLFAMLTPRLFGHSFNNPKDIPFALFYILNIYLILRHLRSDKLSILNSIFLILAIGIAINIRVSGLLLIFYFFLAYLIYHFPISENYKDLFQRKHIISHSKELLKILIIVILGYLSTAIFWPYMQTDILAPIKVLSKVSNFEVFNAYELFIGKWYNAWELSKWYIPVWLIITIPAFVLIGFFAIPIILNSRVYNEKVLKISIFLLFTALFPIIYIIIKESNVYNGIRHLLFVIPSITVISIISWQYILILSKNSSFFYLSRIILIGLMLFTAYKMVKIHPYQAIYFNEVIEGGSGAFKNFETDYWGISTKEAVEWIDEKTPEKTAENPVRIKMFYGDNLKVTHYSKDIEGLEYVYGNPDSGYDFEIIYLSATKFNPYLLRTWPPENTVYEIKADGAPLCAIVKVDKSKTQAKEDGSTIYEIFLNMYNQGLYTDAIYLANNYLNQKPEDYIMLNNIGSALNIIGMYKTAAIYLNKAIEINSDFELAANNLKVSERSEESKSINDLINYSLIAYNLGNYEECVRYSSLAIEINPKSIESLNNICAAKIALGEYSEAIKYCSKALSINPDYEIARNNLENAKKEIKKLNK